jgi:hypothetical protein
MRNLKISLNLRKLYLNLTFGQKFGHGSKKCNRDLDIE